jgi:hypothetical protein
MTDGLQGVSTSTYSVNAILGTTIPPTTANSLSDPFSDPNGPFANLSLSAQQQSEIQSLFSQDTSSGTQTPTQLFQQVENLLTPQQQQTLKSDLETSGAHHHHHHGGAGATDASNPLSQLDLTSDQQTQIKSILTAAKTSGASPSDILAQINDALTTSQQQQLTSLFSGYTSTGTTPQGAQQPVTINTSA